MADVVYHPTTGAGSAVAVILRSGEMRRFMDSAGVQAAARASTYSPTPGALRSETVLAFDRWCANVINTAPDAIWQEYGTKTRPAFHPLARMVDDLRSKDPNRRKGFLARLFGR
jgi:hypothetical protein